MPQYQELPCGGQVLDIDTALKDGILGGALEPMDAAAGDAGKQPVELRKMMDELDAAGDGGGDEVVLLPVVVVVLLQGRRTSSGTMSSSSPPLVMCCCCCSSSKKAGCWNISSR